MLPGPTNVPQEVLLALAKPVISHRGEEFHELYDRIQENLKYVFQTKNDVFVLTTSGTGGVECAVANVTSPGEKVIVPVFGVFSRRMKEKFEAYGAKVVELNFDFGKAPRRGDIERAFEEHPDAKVLGMVYNETSTGAKVVDLPKIAEVAKDHGAVVVVDAISILGGDELKVDEWGIDICVTGSQKCLAAPPGLAFISVSQDAWKVVEKSKSPRYYLDLRRMRTFHSKKETPFTPGLPLLYAVDVALSLIRKEGLESRIERHRKCAKMFYDGLGELGFSFVPDAEFRSNTVIAVWHKSGVNDTKFRSYIKRQHDILIAGGMGELKGKIFRIGCMGIISPKEVQVTLFAVKDALEQVG